MIKKIVSLILICGYSSIALSHGTDGLPSREGLDQLPYSPAKRYSHVVRFMAELAEKYPNTVSVFNIGNNDAGQPIYGLKIGNGPLENLLVATHHGNEYGSTEVAEGFAQNIAQNPIPGQTIYVIPVLNATGYDSRQRYEPARGQFHDPNRDYPGPCGTNGPFNLKSTKALADFLERTNIITSATLHTYWPAVLYPWGISTQDIHTPYTDLFVQLGSIAAEFSKYKVANSTAELYPADGTFEDYAFWKHGIWSMLFEMGRSHTPGTNAIREMVQTNVPGLRRMFEASPVQRAPDHQFRGQCTAVGSRILLRRNE